jgi:hypothetical protein
MRHPRSYLGLPMPDPTSSEFGKETRGSPVPTLGLTGSSSRIRASQRDYSTTVGSPSGERRPPVSRRATAPLLWPVATPATSLARVETEAEEEMKLGFSGERPAPRFCCRESYAQPSISDEWLIRVRLDKAQAGGENAGPGLRCFKFRAVGWVTGRFSFLTRARISCLGSIRPRCAERKSA